MNHSSLCASSPMSKKQKPNIVDTLAPNPSILRDPIGAGMQTLAHHNENGQFSGCDANQNVKRAFLQILGAVRFLHKHTVSHHNICAANIVAVDSEGHRYALCGFDNATTETSVKANDAGTSAYMAPECWRDNGNRTYDPRVAEVWALGVVLVEMLTGVLPWEAAKATDPRFVSAIVWGIPALKHLHVVRHGKERDLATLLFAINPAERVTLDELAHAVQTTKQLQRECRSRDSGFSSWKSRRNSQGVGSGAAEQQKIPDYSVSSKEKQIEQRIHAVGTVECAISQPEKAGKKVEVLRAEARMHNGGLC